MRGVSRRAQEGSVGPLVVLIIVAVLVWWQWDRISRFFGSRTSSGGGALSAEILDYRCEPKAEGGIRIDGRVRNTSEAPVAFRAVTAIYDSSDKRSDYREAEVRPSPLPPGQDGYFSTEGPPLPDRGSCKLGSIVDSSTDRPVRLTRGRH
jgi:hypothetical protein